MSVTKLNRSLAGVHELIGDFDGFIIDQFGVLHDGTQAYTGAIPALQQLLASGKTIVILSNSGKRAHINIDRMATLGFDRSTFSRFVTSGDVAFDTIQERIRREGQKRCLLIARDGDLSAVNGLDLQLTESPSTAELVIISASEADRFAEQHYIDLLSDPAQRRVPCLCTNPDKLMLTPGGIRFGAGRIAEIYEQLGGTVQWLGKPYTDVYNYAMQHFKHIEPGRIVCIGDSIEHDIAGGANAGLATLFVRGGIHQNWQRQ